jgi:hypothetical protein
LDIDLEAALVIGTPNRLVVTQFLDAMEDLVQGVRIVDQPRRKIDMTPSAPGLKRRRRADGSDAYYWVAAAVSRHASEYPIKTVPLHYDSDEARAIRCSVLTDELKRWLADHGKTERHFDGTIGGLIRQYQTLDTSPYHAVQDNTRRDYDQRLVAIDRSVGGVAIANLNAVDFTRWHRNFKKPVATGGAECMRKAHGLMTMIRMLLSFGVSMRFDGCAGTLAVLSVMEFQSPKRRVEALSFEQAEAIIALALASGRRSIALGQALQFELTVRQVDAIGKWTTAPASEGGIRCLDKRWGGGLLWSHVSPDLVISKVTTKTAATGEWDLRDYPLVMKALASFPPADRIGPMIVNELTGRPYNDNGYGATWRPFADAAGVPRSVWNRDSRAGGITEAWDSNAQEKDIQRLATHSDPAMTRRYARNSLASTTRVADLRVAGRKQRENKTSERV